MMLERGLREGEESIVPSWSLITLGKLRDSRRETGHREGHYERGHETATETTETQ
jgi:hypothetical protein